MSYALRSSDRTTSLNIAAYFEQAARRVPSYLGQLHPEFQAALAEHHRDVEAEDCDFYHAASLPDGGAIKGEWDLRHSEADYIGHCDVSGKRVIEFGPASGGLSQYLARQGAELVVFDLPFGRSPELVPTPDADMAAHERDGAGSMDRLRNSWWFMKRALGFEAKAVYGDIYELPDDLGRFDVAMFGALLLHLSQPFRALQRAAAITADTIIVTDVYSAPSIAAATDELRRQVPSLMVFNPTPPPIGLIHWWALSPEVITHMLTQLGFGACEVTTHSPRQMPSRPPLFTVVGHRRRAGVSLATTAAPASAPRVEDGGLPIPTPHLRFMVSGTEDVDTFLILGRRAYDAITRSLERAQIDVAGYRRILDFGCGVGRVLRHWKEREGLEVYGTDLYQNAIDWDRQNLPFATFATNGLTGPLAYPDGHFDFVYALSVFTHLPMPLQMIWFEELVRVLRPGGTLYFTSHGQQYAHMLDPEQLAEFNAGHVVVTGDDQPGSNHCAAFHPPAYVMNDLLKHFNLSLLEFTPCGARGNPDQDSYLLRKNAASKSA